jgi:hypothetical protein
MREYQTTIEECYFIFALRFLPEIVYITFFDLDEFEYANDILYYRRSQMRRLGTRLFNEKIKIKHGKCARMKQVTNNICQQLNQNQQDDVKPQ